MEISAGILFIYKNKVLLCHPTNSSWNMWMPPKGHVEENEDYIQAAIREVEEEVNICIHKDLLNCKLDRGSDTSFEIKYNNKSGAYHKKVVLFTYHINTLIELGLDSEIIPEYNLQIEENDEAKFFNLDELDTFCFWRYRDKIKDILQKDLVD